MIAIYTMSMRDQQDMLFAFYAEYFDSDSGQAKDPRLVLNPFIQASSFVFMPEGMENARIC